MTLIDSKRNGETEAASDVATINGGVRMERNDSGIQDFLNSMSSNASLPGYIKGDGFSSKKGVINQCLVTLAVILLSVGAGQPIGFSAVLLPQLYNETSPMRIDMEMGSWIASIHSAATPIGSFASGALMDAMGRRRALQIGMLPMMAGWVIIATSTTHFAMLVGRVFCGLAVGITGAPSQVYLGEISEPRLRGLLCGCPTVAYAMGILLIYTLGSTVPWRLASALGTVLPGMSLLALAMSPESPTWFARKRRLQQATKSIARVRGDEKIAQRELHQLMSAFEKDKRDAEDVSFWSSLKQRSVLKPLSIIIVFNTLQAMSGTYMIVFYAVDIISGTAGDAVDSVLAANITAAVRFAGTIVASFLLFYLPRRTLALISGTGSTVAVLSLGVYIWSTLSLTKTHVDLWAISGCLLLYIIFNTIGFFILPGMMIGELLPAKGRGMCCGFIVMSYNLTVFGLTKLFPMISSGLGFHGMFIFFGMSSLSCTIFLYLFLPETKGKTLIQIEQYFKTSGYMWITRQEDCKS